MQYHQFSYSCWSYGLSITTNPSLRRMLWICDPFTMMNPRSLVIYFLFSCPTTSLVLSSTRFMVLSQLLSSPQTSLPPLNFTTISFFSRSLSLMIVSLETLIFNPIDFILTFSIINSCFYHQIINQKVMQETSLTQRIGSCRNPLVHHLIDKHKAPDHLTMQRISLVMDYQEYTPKAFNFHTKARNNSCCTPKNKTTMKIQIKKSTKLSLSQKKNIDNFTLTPNKVEVEFFRTKTRSKKIASRQSEVIDYNTMMSESMKNYMIKIEKEKNKKKEKFEENIRSFGVNIAPINCTEIKERLELKRELEHTLKIERKKNAKDKSNTLPTQSYMVINQKCKTEKSQFNRTQMGFQPKKFNIRSEKKDNNEDKSKQQYKLEKTLNFFSVFLSSFGVYIEKAEHPISLIGTKKKLKRFSYYVGKGNNKYLIISILKKRWWWTETDDMNNADLVWTQLKVPSIIKKQNKVECSMLSEMDISAYKNGKPIKKSKTSKNDLPSKIFHAQSSEKFHSKLSPYDQKKYLRQMKPPSLLHNHYSANYMLGNKKALFYNLRQYCLYKNENLFDILPLTFHVEKVNSKSFKAFEKKANELKKACWIVKPGENSNQGQGILVTDSMEKLKAKIQKNKKHTYIIQKYIKNVFLFQKRKFDIRTYIIMLTVGGVHKFYWYSEGYIRTSSEFYDLSDLSDPFIHLTNDKIQCDGQNYGKFEKGNKITYYEFQKYLDFYFAKEKYSMNALTEKMKQVAITVAKSMYFKIDKQNVENGFELFGMDFLIDGNFKPWLLEVNTNPCLELSSPVIERLIPRMIENLFRMAVDPLFQPTCSQFPRSTGWFIPDNILENNRFQLIFDSLFDRDIDFEAICNSIGEEQVYEDEDKQFEDDGEIINIDD